MSRLTIKKLSLIFGITFVSATASAGPAVQIVNDAFDFGKTLQHSTVSHTFWIKSTGNATLRITEVNPGCGCTRAPLRDSTLSPGDSTALEIIFSTRSFAGQITKRPYLKTNASPDKVYITISSDVVTEPDLLGPLRLTPYHIDVSQQPGKERRHALFLIENVSGQPLQLRLVDVPSDYLEVTLPDKLEPGETSEGLVVVRPGAAAVAFDKSFTFEVSGADRTRFSMPVRRLMERGGDDQP